MYEQRISFETSKLIKELGFHWSHMVFKELPKSDEIPFSTKFEGISTNINYCYNESGQEITPKRYSPKNNHYPRPTQIQLKNWIKEKYDIYLEIRVDKTTEPKYCYTIYSYKHFGDWKQHYVNNGQQCCSDLYHNEEQAFEDGLIECLQIIKNTL